MNKQVTIIEDFVGNLFEKKFSLYVANGTTALYLALVVAEIKERKVVVPVNVCLVVVCAIIASGNNPCFVDIDENGSIDVEKLKSVSNDKIAAVIVPHMYGNAANIVNVAKIAEKNKWIVIEDVAQSLGGKIGNKYLGSFANYAITSFGGGKIVDVGIGGVLTLNDRNSFNKAVNCYRKLNVFSQNSYRRYLTFSDLYVGMLKATELGDNLEGVGGELIKAYQDANVGSMEVTSEALGNTITQLKSLSEILEARINNHSLYLNILINSHVKVVSHNPGSTYWRQNILVDNNRDEFIGFLRANKIKASKYFPPIDRLFYKRLFENEYQNADLFYQKVVNLWSGKETSKEDILRLSELIMDFYK